MLFYFGILSKERNSVRHYYYGIPDNLSLLFKKPSLELFHDYKSFFLYIKQTSMVRLTERTWSDVIDEKSLYEILQ